MVMVIYFMLLFFFYHNQKMQISFNFICISVAVKIFKKEFYNLVLDVLRVPGTHLTCCWPWFLHKHSPLLGILGILPKWENVTYRLFSCTVTHLKMLNLWSWHNIACRRYIKTHLPFLKLGGVVAGYGDCPGGPVAKTLCSQCRGPGFDPWLGN